MSHLKKSIFINTPLKKVVDFGTNPNKWALWYAHLSGPEKLTGEGEAGTKGEFKYSLLGIHLPMTVEVKESVTTETSHFWKGTFEGPLSGVQTFSYLSKDNGTDVTVEIEYTVPGSILGKIADVLIIEKLQENATIHTLENLKAICESL